MKKITYGLSFGILGSLNSGKEILIEYLKETALQSANDLYKSEFLIIFKDVPIKMKIFNVRNIDELIYKYDEIQKFKGMDAEIRNFIKHYKEKTGKEMPSRFASDGTNIEDSAEFVKLNNLVQNAYLYASNKIKSIDMYKNASNSAPTEEIKAEMQEDKQRWKRYLGNLEKLKEALDNNKETQMKM